MRILVIGANGTIGKTVVTELSKRHEVIKAGRTSGDISVNIDSAESIENMFRNTSDVDALVNAAGDAKWAPFQELTEADYYESIGSKLMGQVNLVRIGQDYLNEGGSFTLTTGILAEHPVDSSVGPSLVNGAIHSFVLAASRELKQGLRLNVVAAGLVEDSADKYRDFFPGHTPVSMQRVAEAYAGSVEGTTTGEIIRVY